MIYSMTGYGRKEGTWNQMTVIAEVRSVNHRFSEVMIRAPKMFSSLEDGLKRIIQERCHRGRVELSLSVSGTKEAGKTLVLDWPLARQYYHMLDQLQQELQLGGTIDLSLLVANREVVSSVEEPVQDESLRRKVEQVVIGALAELNAMRRREGQALRRDMRERLAAIQRIEKHIRARGPVAVRAQWERMKQRIQALVDDVPVDGARLSQELAVYADRADITEELTRFESHVHQFRATLTTGGTVGRRLDFLLQELGREVNTIGAKANDLEISSRVVDLKSALEKLREQAQNIQ